jgi:hypothetical protein
VIPFFSTTLRAGVYCIRGACTFWFDMASAYRRPIEGPSTTEVDLMARVDLTAKVPLIGMCLVFLAMFIVAVTAYLHAGWYSIIGYAIAAAVAVAGFVMTFRDISDTPGPPEQWDARGTPTDPASPGN